LNSSGRIGRESGALAATDIPRLSLFWLASVRTQDRRRL